MPIKKGDSGAPAHGLHRRNVAEGQWGPESRCSVASAGLTRSRDARKATASRCIVDLAGSQTQGIDGA